MTTGGEGGADVKTGECMYYGMHTVEIATENNCRGYTSLHFSSAGRCSPDVGVVFVMLVLGAAGENSYCSATAELSGTYYPKFPGSEPA